MCVHEAFNSFPAVAVKTNNKYGQTVPIINDI